ncbi:MAG: alpha-1,4-glucan--maltose-1-phosphate maltosyltransferase [Thermoanaerobaculia bacterium]
MVDFDGRRRVIIEAVTPEIDCGRFPVKRVTGERVTVEADVFTDGHDIVSGVLLYRPKGESSWQEVSLSRRSPAVPDRWVADFVVSRVGIWEYTLEAWIDHFLGWYRDLQKRSEADEPDLTVHFEIGARMIDAAARRSKEFDQHRMREYVELLRSDAGRERKIAAVFDEQLVSLMKKVPDRRLATRYARCLDVLVERPRAGFSSWYEMFPRSASPETGRHGTFRDMEARLPYIAGMGFDVLYLPPIHPIGRSWRKGRNNSLDPAPADPGSPWAIGSESGGHTAIHPELGTLEDFRSLVRSAGEKGIEIALDIAFQASPDHPWVEQHPEWFRWRPDETVQYAENPPKKYQDIYPFDFESEQWETLWGELRDVFLYWLGEGVRIFRVDNPHTKPLPFWEWVIAEVRKRDPEVIFLAEAFTRPRVMYHLAKAGFSQSYTYFTWRNTKWELTRYFTELTRTEVGEFFRPNAWPNTPDILPEPLQWGGRPMFMSRLILAATLSSNYGIYGPLFELLVSQPREQGSEEYLDSEKYEIRNWDLDQPQSLRELIALVNRIRRENPALHSNATLRFHETSNDHIICYSKSSHDGSNVIYVVVNLDPWNTQGGDIDFSFEELKEGSAEPIQVHDLLTNARFTWPAGWHHLNIDPQVVPGRIFRIRRRVRSERDFDYYM